MLVQARPCVQIGRRLPTQTVAKVKGRIRHMVKDSDKKNGENKTRHAGLGAEEGCDKVSDSIKSKSSGVKQRAGTASNSRLEKVEKKTDSAAPGGDGAGLGQRWRHLVVLSLVIILVAFAALAFFDGGAGTSSNDSGRDRQALSTNDRAAAAKLKHREQALSAALTEACGAPVSTASSDTTVGTTIEAGLGIARSIVHEVLLRRERQLMKGTIKRAVTLHIAGDLGNPDKREWTLKYFDRITSAIERFVLGGFKSSSALHIGKKASDWERAREVVAAHLTTHQQAVIILHNADKAEPERLYDLEDAFEARYLQHKGVRADCAGAVFVLLTSLGADITPPDCGGDPCTAQQRFFCMIVVLARAAASVTTCCLCGLGCRV